MPAKKYAAFSLLFIFFLACHRPVSAQVNASNLFPDYRPPVTVNGQQLAFPWTGGLNSPVFSQIDLNGDGFMDLLAFDRVGNRLSLFINNAIPGAASYHFAPEYLPLFPYIHDWVRTADFDCDGDMDLFSYGNNTMIVYRNDYTAQTGLVFSPVTQSLNTANGNGIYVSQVNMPAITDADGDGDLDILSFSSSSNYVEYFKNFAVDSGGTCAAFNYYLDPFCWGFFKLSGLSNIGILNDNCGSVNKNGSSLHSGSVLTAFDQDCDGDIDLINGDILGENLLYLHNSGSPDSAYVDTQDSLYPSYNVSLDMQNLPAPYYLDVDNDGAKDLLVSPFATVGEDYNNVWFYRNTTDNCTHVFNRITQRFLVSEMVDVGTASNVALFDVNNDGLDDIIAGNDLYYNANPSLSVARLAYFQNTGTAAAPAFTLISDDWLNVSAFSQYGLSPAFGDLDGDGDKDMLLGNADGQLILYTNTAAPGQPSNFVYTSALYAGIDVGNNNSPQVIDVNRDGKPDLLIGERTGNLNYYENTGTITTPQFTLVSANFGGVNVLKPGAIAGYSKPLLFDSAGIYRLIVGSESGDIYSYSNIDGNLNGTFTLTDTMYQGIEELKRVSIASADIDGDGYPDLLTGCNAGGMRFYTHHQPTPVEEVAGPVFNFYPNPSNESCTIKFFNAAERLITVTDINGRIIKTINTQQPAIILETGSYASGMYLLKVSGHDRTYCRKLIVQH